MHLAKETLSDDDLKELAKIYGDNWNRGDYFTVGVKLEEMKHHRPRAIEFCPVKNTKAPDNYVALLLRFEHTLSVLRTLFPGKDATSAKKFNEYFGRLTELARAALGQDQPHLGALGLQTFHDEVVMREGGRIKNSYAVKLGWWALGLGSLAIGAFLLSQTSYLNLKDVIKYPNLWLMLLGCFLGTWLSFSIRKPSLTFDELAVPEEDQLQPPVRLLFVAGLTVVVFLLFATGVVKVAIGSLNTDSLLEPLGNMKAILIGCFCGIGEKALPGVLSKRSNQFVIAIGGEKPASETDEGAGHPEKTGAASTASHEASAHHHADSHKKS